MLSGITQSFPWLSRSWGYVTDVLLPRLPLSPSRRRVLARLACLIHAANVHSEPGSNPSRNMPVAGTRTEVLMPAAPSAEGCRPELALKTTAACGTPIRRPGSRTQKNSIVVVPLGQRGTPATTSLETQRDLIRFIQPNCQRAKPLRRRSRPSGSRVPGRLS